MTDQPRPADQVPVPVFGTVTAVRQRRDERLVTVTYDHGGGEQNVTVEPTEPIRKGDRVAVSYDWPALPTVKVLSGGSREDADD